MSVPADMLLPGRHPLGVAEFDADGVRTCVVHGHGATYIIEPLRNMLGLTRVQMLDAHLRDAITEHPDDVDVLLDARAAFAAEAG